jgi:hypothetical protein
VRRSDHHRRLQGKRLAIWASLLHLVSVTMTAAMSAAAVPVSATAVPATAAAVPVSATAVPATSAAVPATSAAMPATAAVPVSATAVATASPDGSDDDATAPTRRPAPLSWRTAAAPRGKMTIGPAASRRLGRGGRERGQSAEGGEGDYCFSQGFLLLR